MKGHVLDQPLEVNATVAGSAKIRIALQVIHAVTVDLGTHDLRKDGTEIRSAIDKEIVR